MNDNIIKNMVRVRIVMEVDRERRLARVRFPEKI